MQGHRFIAAVFLLTLASLGAVLPLEGPGFAVLGALAVLGGLWLSLEADTPTGPSVVAAACVLFAFCHAGAALRRR